MAITFPASPTNGQTFTSGNKTWQWDGTTWLAYGASLSPTVLKVDAANARVGINNQSPAYALDVNGTIEGTQFLQGTDYLSPYQGFRNLLINGAMNIWQRATNTGTLGLGGGGYYGADRWWLYNNGYTSTMSRELVGSTLPTFLYCMRFQRTSGQTSVVPSVLHTPQETINSVRFAGKQATLSFYARASSGMSNTSGVTIQVITGTGTDQSNLGGGTYTGSATPISTTPTLTTSWQRFTATGTIASTTTEIDVQISYIPTGTAGASDYFEITGIQLEEGSVATPFEHRPIGTELALCQRYFQLINSYMGNGDFNIPMIRESATQGQSTIFLPVSMRVYPSLYGAAYGRCVFRDTAFNVISSLVSSISLNGSGPSFNAVTLVIVHLSASGTYIFSEWDMLLSSVSLGLSAEL